MWCTTTIPLLYAYFCGATYYPSSKTINYTFRQCLNLVSKVFNCVMYFATICFKWSHVTDVHVHSVFWRTAGIHSWGNSCCSWQHHYCTNSKYLWSMTCFVDLCHTSCLLSQYMGSAPRPPVTKYVVVLEDEKRNIRGPWNFLGNSSSLSLNISSPPQCISYTVSVTASNTGGSITTNTTLCELLPAYLVAPLTENERWGKLRSDWFLCSSFQYERSS